MYTCIVIITFSILNVCFFLFIVFSTVHKCVCKALRYLYNFALLFSAMLLLLTYDFMLENNDAIQLIDEVF